MAAGSDIRGGLLAYLAEDVECVSIPGEGGRIACSTPLEYPDGDAVVAWVGIQDAARVEVTDYGRGYRYLLSHPPQDRAALRQMAATTARGQAVEFLDGRLSAWPGEGEVSEAVWRIASASMQIAQAAEFFRPRRHPRDSEFEREVDAALRERHVQVERNEEVLGASTHVHHATFLLPRHKTVLEPVAGTGHYSQVASVYTKFGDIAQADGHRLLSLVDDREVSLRGDFVVMLGQVSEVLRWSEKNHWLSEVAT
jgi:hypothetical protein